MSLFRQEVLEAQKTQWTGTVILTRPLSFTLFTLGAFAIGLVLVVFLFFGEYTKRSTVTGQLIPEQGLIVSHSPELGTVLENHVYDGKVVKKGDLLYTISTAHYDDLGNTQKAIAMQLETKKELIKTQIANTKQSQKQEINGILNAIDRLKLDKQKLMTQIELQKTQVQLAEDNLARYRLASQHEAVSLEALHEKETAWANQVATLNHLERELLNINQQIKEQKITLSRTRSTHQINLNQLNQSLTDNEQNTIQNKAGELIAVYAPIDGVISNVNIKLGQFVDSSRPLLNILPADNDIIAELYVPSRAIGFVKDNDEVLLRYTAYPYQKFGHASGRVFSVAKTALAGQNIPTIGTVATNEQMANEPLYLVRVKLDRQTIKAYGNDMPLRVGMTLEGDIMHETRRLYEWVLEPLYSISGQI